MYLPRNLPLCRPHVAMWTGASGKRYDFAVCRPGTIGVDEPAVYILARHDGQLTTPLFVGHTTSLHRRFGLSGGRCPEQWRRALATGMTHVHLRFDTFSKMTPEAEVSDLVAALRPVLNDQLEEDRSVPALESAELEAPRTGRTRLYRHERWGAGSEARSPVVAAIGIERQSLAERAVASPLFRADPAREEDSEPGDFDTPAVDAPPGVECSMDMRGDDKTLVEFEQEADVIQLAPAVPAGSPDVLREPNEQLTQSFSRGDDDVVVQTTASAEPARLTGFLARVRELVARLRTPGRPDPLEDAGSAPRLVPAAAPAVIVEPLAAAGAAGLSAGTGETCGGVWDATPVPHETRASEDTSSAEPISAEALEISSSAEPISAEALEISSSAEPISAEALEISSSAEPISAEALEISSSAEPISAEALEISSSAEPISAEALEISSSAEPVEVLEDASPPEPIAAEAPDADRSGQIVAEAPEDAASSGPIAAEGIVIGQQEARRGLDLDPFAPVVLFAGNLSYEAGADILLDAIVTVCAGNHEAQFLFAGDGALKGDLQGWASRAGLDRRCRFLGHVPADSFDRVLKACDFVVIPARVRQDEALARAAIDAGKPVVTTHQAAIPLIVHGQNGLITYDNPGSLVWAIGALLSPLCASLRRQLAETA